MDICSSQFKAQCKMSWMVECSIHARIKNLHSSCTCVSRLLFLRSWVGMLRGAGARNVLIVGLVRSMFSMFFVSVHHYDSQRQQILDHMKQILTPEAFEALHLSSIFDNAVFCLSERQGMLVNDEHTIVIKFWGPHENGDPGPIFTSETGTPIFTVLKWTCMGRQNGPGKV